MLTLGNSCAQENNKENIITTNVEITNAYEETVAKKAIRDSVPINDPVNVIIKRDDLKKEINIFIDTLYYRKDTLKEVKGVSLTIMKNTDKDFAIKLIYTSSGCSEYLVGLTDYKYRDLFVYLLTKEGLNYDFFELKYKGICEKLEDHSTLINKTHYIQFYEMLRNIPQKILYYEKKDGKYILTNIFYNDLDVPK